MRLLRSFVLALLLVPLPLAAQAWRVEARQPDTALAGGAVLHRCTVGGADQVELSVVQFSSTQCKLRIIDQPSKAEAVTLGKAMERTSAIAGVNGGFFSPAFEPMGLLISQGKRVGAWQKSSLLGGVVAVRKGRLMLLWRDEFKDGPGISELLQAGPRLVNHGAPVTGLENLHHRPRTFIATDNDGHWLLGIAQSATLAGLSQILATPGLLPKLQVDRALNFDGGHSTGLWCREAEGRIFYEEEISTVRNFVAVVPRE